MAGKRHILVLHGERQLVGMVQHDPNFVALVVQANYATRLTQALLHRQQLGCRVNQVRTRTVWRDHAPRLPRRTAHARLGRHAGAAPVARSILHPLARDAQSAPTAAAPRSRGTNLPRAFRTGIRPAAQRKTYVQ